MIPIPPLDGGRVAVGLLPDALAFPLARLERYGIFILIALLIVLPMIGEALHADLDLLHYVLVYPVGYALDGIEWITGRSPIVSEIEPFELKRAEAPAPVELVVDLEGYEGPIDMLLTLAREQKVDITKISILALADQYLALHLGRAPAQARDRRRLSRHGGVARLSEIAPAAAGAGAAGRTERRRARGGADPSAAAARGDAAGGRAPHGAPAARTRRVPARRAGGSAARVEADLRRDASMSCCAPMATSASARKARCCISARPSSTRWTTRCIVWSACWAAVPEWRSLMSFLPPGLRGGVIERSAVAATFAASLELVRSGKLQLRQERAFGPIYIRSPSDTA